jgi:RNA-directed DNA polymerase
VLPQGSPSSPTLTNILCKNLDRRLNGLAKRFGATYTRYADDITFSSPHSIFNDEGFNKELYRIIEEDQKLVINPKKTRLQKSGYRQEVTGLIVNDKVNVRRRYVKQIRMWLYYWEKYGYEKAEAIFKRDYIADKGHVKNIKTSLVNVLIGKLEFLKMVKGVEDETYLGLRGKLQKLTCYNGQFSDAEIIEKILDIWEKDGIEQAEEKLNQLTSWMKGD